MNEQGDERRSYPHHFEPPHPEDTVDRPLSAPLHRPAGPRPPRPWYQLIAGQWPLAITLALVAAGVGWAGLGHWKRGSTLLGLAFAMACLLRIFLPENRVGLLGVRGRLADSLCLGVLGIGILLLALVVPPQL